MPAPTFLGIGAQKAGTTWLFSMVAQHPGVVSGKRKELHYFNLPTRYDRPREWYEGEFDVPEGGVGGRAVGECTPAYLWTTGDPSTLEGEKHVLGTAERVAALYGPGTGHDLRLVVCLRDPVDRAPPSLRHPPPPRRPLWPAHVRARSPPFATIRLGRSTMTDAVSSGCGKDSSLTSTTLRSSSVDGFRGLTHRLKRTDNRLNHMKYQLYSAAFEAIGRLAPCDPSDALVIAGAPRSGTTWLLEVLEGLPGYKALNEPLLRQGTRAKHGFRARSYVAEGHGASLEKKAFLTDVLSGRVGPDMRWAFRGEGRRAALLAHARNRKVLVKFCRINRMLPWFGTHFLTRGLIFVVRHPCAVVSSMVRFGWEHVFEWRDKPWSPLQIDDLPGDVQDVFAPLVERVRDRLDALAVIWCLDHYVPLVYSREHPWLLVPYERLVLNGAGELGRIADGVGFDLDERIEGRIDLPSSSVKGRVEESAVDQILKWKHQLDPESIDRVLSFVDECGLSAIYDDAVEPNYERLNAVQDGRYQW